MSFESFSTTNIDVPCRLTQLAGVATDKCINLSDLDKPMDLSRSYLPREGGSWSGEAGESTWEPDDGNVPNRYNPENKTWGEIKAEFDIKGIDFDKGEPDFTGVAEAVVKIDDFTTERPINFAQADEACAKQWTAEGKDEKSWSAADVRDYRQENKLSWHERSDQMTLDLVPMVVHANIPHSGGISAAKNRGVS